MNDIILQITNGTQGVNSIDANAIVSVSAVAVALVIGFVTIIYSKKQHTRNSLTDVFSLLNTKEHKTAEHELRRAYQTNELFLVNQINDKFEEYYNTVRRNYAQIGVLIEEGVIPKKAYYITFGVITVVTYIIVQEEIKRKQLTRPLFMAHFHNLAYDCLNYWIKQNLTEIHPIVDPKTNEEITLERIGRKIDSISRKKFKGF